MKVKIRRRMGSYVNELSDGRNIVLIEDVSSALNLTKLIKQNTDVKNLVIEPVRQNTWGLTWRGKAPVKLGESRDFIYFDF
jgi:hypothetical protein